MKPELLFLYAHMMISPAQGAGGGQKTAWRNLVWLADKYAVHLVVFRTEANRDATTEHLWPYCASIKVVDVTQATRLRGILAAPLTPLIVAARRHAGVMAAVNRQASGGRLTRIHCEHTQLAQYLPIARHVPERTVYVQDVLTQWAQRKVSRTGLGREFWRWEARRTAAWEADHYRLCTRVFVPSLKDQKWVAELAPEVAACTCVVPPHYDIYRSATPRDYDRIAPQLLFWGAMNRRENIDAARWLCDRFASQLRQELPQASIVLAGVNPPASLKKYLPHNVRVTGFVPDPTSLFAQSHVAVFPLVEGAGVKVKVLEALAAGLPVVTTDIGAEGIEATAADGLIVLKPDPDVFVSTIASLWRNRDKVAQLSQAALAWSVRQGCNRHGDLLEGGHDGIR